MMSYGNTWLPYLSTSYFLSYPKSLDFIGLSSFKNQIYLFFFTVHVYMYTGMFIFYCVPVYMYPRVSMHAHSHVWRWSERTTLENVFSLLPIQRPD